MPPTSQRRMRSSVLVPARLMAGAGGFAVLILLAHPVRGQVVDPKFWITNGTVNAVVKSGNALYIGGEFDYVGPATGGGADEPAARSIRGHRIHRSHHLRERPRRLRVHDLSANRVSQQDEHREPARARHQASGDQGTRPHAALRGWRQGDLHPPAGTGG